MVKALLLNDTEYWYHWGCCLTSRALKQLIGERYQLTNTIAISRLRAMPYAPEAIEDFNNPDFLTHYLEDNAEIINQIHQADVVYINGEGSLHGGSPLALNLLMLALISKQVLAKRVYLVNHSAYPNDALSIYNNALDHLYRDIYKLLDGVAIREKGSLALMQQLGVSQCRQSFDCSVLALQPNRAMRHKVIALGGSVSVGLQGMDSVLRALAVYQQQGYEIRFLYGAAANPAADDLQLLQRLNQQTLCAITPVCCHSVEQFCDEIGTSALMVSGRFHYSIVAYALGTPVVMLGSNTPKNTLLADQLGVAAPLAWDADDLKNQLLDGVTQALSVDHFVVHAAEQLPQLQQLARQNLF